MTAWSRRLPFRTRLTLGWTLAFGLLLAIANVAIYATFRTYLERDLDQKVRTIAATELASSIDGLDIHLHEVPRAPNGLRVLTLRSFLQFDLRAMECLQILDGARSA